MSSELTGMVTSAPASWSPLAMSVRRCSRQAGHRTTAQSAVASASGTVRGGGTQCGPSAGHKAGRDSA
eukprot:11168422-Lingulodinium_polyedra.AAC.1